VKKIYIIVVLECLLILVWWYSETKMQQRAVMFGGSSHFYDLLSSMPLRPSSRCHFFLLVTFSRPGFLDLPQRHPVSVWSPYLSRPSSSIV